MGRKTRNKKDAQIDFLEEALDNNVTAMKEYSGRRRKWTIHDLKTIKPLNTTQKMMLEAYIMGNNVLAMGSAGTGKSYLALFLALNDILQKDTPRDHIIIVRSAVQARDVGFLPGSIEEKLEPYELPYKDILHDLLGKPSSYDNMKEEGVIRFMCTSLIRGMSWDNAVIVIDEMQSCNLHELSSVITRCGANSKIIALGDLLQNDLQNKKYDQSGMADFVKIIGKMSEFDIINFTKDDIVRSKLVRSYLIAYEEVMQ